MLLTSAFSAASFFAPSEKERRRAVPTNGAFPSELLPRRATKVNHPIHKRQGAAHVTRRLAAPEKPKFDLRMLSSLFPNEESRRNSIAFVSLLSQSVIRCHQGISRGDGSRGK